MWLEILQEEFCGKPLMQQLCLAKDTKQSSFGEVTQF